MMTINSTTVNRRGRRPTGFRGFKFDQEMIKEGPGILKEYRENAWQTYELLPFPNTEDEAWRRTDLRSLSGSVSLPEVNAYLNLASVPEDITQPLVDTRHGGQIILLPGGIQKSISEEIVNSGVIFTDFLTAADEFPELFNQAIGQIVKPEEGKFASLAAAMAENGVFAYVPPGVQVEYPLHSLLWAAGSGLAHFSHLLIWLDEGSSLTYVHENASPEETEDAVHCGIVEIHVDSDASLRFVELQSFGNHIWNFTHERVKVYPNAQVDWVFGAIGTRLTKNFSDLDLVGPGASGRMSGFYFTDGEQHLDHDTQQNHLAHHTTSDLLFKGALKGNSRSVWQGMIYVAPGAQQTDGYQANRNLVLSKNARADSIPGLEILANDVRCTHGATVGKIDPDLVFYLRSRGISPEEAEKLVVEGFFEPIMDRIPFDGVKTRFRNAIDIKMNVNGG